MYKPLFWHFCLQVMMTIIINCFWKLMWDKRKRLGTCMRLGPKWLESRLPLKIYFVCFFFYTHVSLYHHAYSSHPHLTLDNHGKCFPFFCFPCFKQALLRWQWVTYSTKSKMACSKRKQELSLFLTVSPQARLTNVEGMCWAYNLCWRWPLEFHFTRGTPKFASHTKSCCCCPFFILILLFSSVHHSRMLSSKLCRKRWSRSQARSLSGGRAAKSGPTIKASGFEGDQSSKPHRFKLKL